MRNVGEKSQNREKGGGVKKGGVEGEVHEKSAGLEDKIECRKIDPHPPGKEKWEN